MSLNNVTWDTDLLCTCVFIHSVAKKQHWNWKHSFVIALESCLHAHRSIITCPLLLMVTVRASWVSMVFPIVVHPQQLHVLLQKVSHRSEGQSQWSCFLLQFRYKRRVYTQTHLDDKQLAKLHTKVRDEIVFSFILVRKLWISSH